MAYDEKYLTPAERAELAELRKSAKPPPILADIDIAECAFEMTIAITSTFGSGPERRDEYTSKLSGKLRYELIKVITRHLRRCATAHGHVVAQQHEDLVYGEVEKRKAAEKRTAAAVKRADGAANGAPSAAVFGRTTGSDVFARTTPADMSGSAP